MTPSIIVLPLRTLVKHSPGLLPLHSIPYLFPHIAVFPEPVDHFLVCGVLLLFLIPKQQPTYAKFKLFKLFKLFKCLKLFKRLKLFKLFKRLSQFNSLFFG